MRRVLLISLALLPTLAAAQGQIAVTVEGVRNGQGTVRVAICTRAEFLQPHCAHVGEAPARAGDVVVLVGSVPPGVYAAQAFHDFDNSGRIQTNWLGIPLVGMGFSNDVTFHFGPPGFADAAFRVTPAGAAISFRLRYFD